MELALQVCQRPSLRLTVFRNVWGFMPEDVFYAIIAPRPLGKVDHGHTLDLYRVSPFGKSDMDLGYVEGCMTKINGSPYVNTLCLPNQGIQDSKLEALRRSLYAA